MKLPEGVNPKYGIFTTNREFADKIIDQYPKVKCLNCRKEIGSVILKPLQSI